jgi:predicted DNA binding CopG/RHH family protein
MDISPNPDDPRGHPKKDSETQIVGFRMSPSLAHDVKMEASRRGMSLKALFAEMWEQYKHRSKK